MRRIVSTVAVVCLMATMAGAQTSVGFEETADLADLLAYRLPDWGWRTWDLAGELQGGGNATKSINPSAEARRDQSDHSFRLATDFRLERESENHDLAVRLWGDGAWQRSRTGIGDSGDHNSTLTGEYDVSARGRLHVAQSAWFVTAFVRSLGTYEERHRDAWSPDHTSEYTSVRRNGGSLAAAGAVSVGFATSRRW